MNSYLVLKFRKDRLEPELLRSPKNAQGLCGLYLMPEWLASQIVMDTPDTKLFRIVEGKVHDHNMKGAECTCDLPDTHPVGLPHPSTSRGELHIYLFENPDQDNPE